MNKAAFGKRVFSKYSSEEASLTEWHQALIPRCVSAGMEHLEMYGKVVASTMCWCFFLVAVLVTAVPAQGPEGPGDDRVCRPVLEKASSVQLGESGIFRWACSSRQGTGNNYFIVFVRPSGTYVLLKVSEGRTLFEFAPDVPGQWRWIVINTDPDKTKPDVESEPGSFYVTPMPGAEQ